MDNIKAELTRRIEMHQTMGAIRYRDNQHGYSQRVTAIGQELHAEYHRRAWVLLSVLIGSSEW